MSSSLRVNTIVPSTGTNVAIGTANGTVTFTDSVNFVLGTGSSIFSPASNTLTFGTNDAERLRIDSAGRIGVNATSPGAMLQVDYDEGSSEVGLRLRAYNASGSKTWQLSEINGNAGVFTIRNATNSQDILSIDGVNQRVGVNNTSPDHKVSVYDAGYCGLELKSNRSTATDNIGGVHWKTQSTNVAYLQSLVDGTIRFRNTSSLTERLRITSDGKVGINETAPAADLVVKQSGNTFTTQSQTVALFQRSSTAGHGAKIAIVAGTGGSSDINFGDTDDEDIGIIQYYHTDNSFRFTTNTSERLRIDSSGRLLLNSGTDVRIELGTTGSTGTNNRNHLRGDGTNMKYNCCAGGGHFFEANGGERMRIDSGGRVNIGDAHLTQTSSYLHVGRSTGGTAAGESIIAATLGNDTTMVSALLTVKNAGNRGAQGATGGSPLAKFEFNNGTAFEIDKNGYRTLPYQPCAMAYNAQGQHMAGNAVAQFNSTRFNIGGMYNSSNGRMTVPVDGRYLVAYSGLHDYISQNAIGFDIRINGSNFNGGEGYQEDTSSSNSQLSKTLILHLSANDYVEIFIRQSGTQVHQRYGSFSVCLLT